MNLALTLTLLGSILGIATPPATQPTPTVEGPPVIAPDAAPPATMPAQPPAAAAAQPIPIRTVAVFPLALPRNDQRYTWIARSVQEDLISSLTAIPGMQASVLRGDAKAPTDDATAVARATKLGASLAVYGQYQLMDPDVRLVVKVADATTNKVIGSVRATGAIQDLAKLEDVLGQQVQQLILNPTGTTVAAVGGTNGPAAPATQPSAPEMVTPPPQPPIASGPVVYFPPTQTLPPDETSPEDNGWEYPPYNWLSNVWYPGEYPWWGPLETCCLGPWCWGGFGLGPSLFVADTAPVFFHHFDHRYFHHGGGHEQTAGPGSHQPLNAPVGIGTGPVHHAVNSRGIAPGVRGTTPAVARASTGFTPGIRSFNDTGVSMSRSGPPVVAHNDAGVGGTPAGWGSRGAGQSNTRSTTWGSPARPGAAAPEGTGTPAVREYNFVTGRPSPYWSATPSPTTGPTRLVGGRFFVIPRTFDFTSRPEATTPSSGGHIFVSGGEGSGHSGGYAGVSQGYAGPAYEPAARGGFETGYRSFEPSFHSFAPSFGGEFHGFEGGGGVVGGGFERGGITAGGGMGGNVMSGGVMSGGGGGRGGGRGGR